MQKRGDNIAQKTNKPVANAITEMSGVESSLEFVDIRPEAIAQRRFQKLANSSASANQFKAMQRLVSTTMNKVVRPELARTNTKSDLGTKIIQRKLTFSGRADEIQHALDLINLAYRVGLPVGQNAALGLVVKGEDGYRQPKFEIVEITQPRLDGIGSHLIGKIINEGYVNIYFGEDRNDASPTDAEKSSKGEASGGTILLSTGATPIELIHELIHTYHFNFDPWNALQKEQQIANGMNAEDGEEVSAEEASTVGLGQWSDFVLTENNFRTAMGLELRTKY